jgi:phosphate transport system permease protein
MSESYQTSLVRNESTLYERATGITAGVGFLTFVFALAALFQIIDITTPVFGFSLGDVFGGLLFVLGIAVGGFGVVSWTESVETDPTRTAGLLTGFVYGLIGFVAAGLIGSQMLGLGFPLWTILAILGFVGSAALTIVPREDLGSMLPPAILVAGIGATFLTGVIGPAWAWIPGPEISGTFTAPIVVPALTAFGGLLTAWGCAKANAGFGSQGRQRAAFMLIRLNVLGMLAVLVTIVAFIVMNGAGVVFKNISVGPGLSFHWPFVMNGYTFLPEVPNGVWPAIVGTVWLIVGAVVFAVPLGIGVAVFLTEYAEQGKATRIADITTHALWSTPSIVFGLFGYAFLVPRLGGNLSIFAGMLVLGFMLLPLVIITSREAIKAVPGEYRDASAALGVSEWQTIRGVVLPASIPGVVTGTILGIGRIAGETAPLLLVMGATLRIPQPHVISGFRFVGHPPFITNPALLERSQALPLMLYAIITHGVGAGTGVPESFGWGTALVLLLVVLSFYALGIGTRIYFRRKLHHE